VSPAKPKLADPGQLIRGAKQRTAEFRVCVDPDLVAEHDRLLLARQAAAEAAADSLAGNSAAAGIDAEIEALLGEIEKNTVVLQLRALPRPRFRAIVDQHPPRKDDDDKVTNGLDFQFGVHFDDTMAELIPASLVGPDLDDDERRILLDELLTDAQYIALAVACWDLNREVLNVPFSSGGSASRRTSSRK
jgi:hypothetical protein